MYPAASHPPITVQRWPTERPLLALNGLVAACLWSLLALSTQSVLYIAVWVVIYALMHGAFVASIRGNAIRVGPDQFPELHERVQQIATRMGMRPVPDVYLMQQDGALNAFAMRFLRSHMIVLLSDLLEACGDDLAARDMIIGHELGHIRAGHLRARWLLMPAAFVPFLGAALSRAREFTCDRYGYAAAGQHDGALLGLAILAGGGKYGRLANREQIVRQCRDLGSLWMTVGQWLGSHPPLARRVLALAPELHAMDGVQAPRTKAALHYALAGIVVAIVCAGTVAAYLPRFAANYDINANEQWSPAADAEERAHRDLMELKAFIEDERRAGRALPWDIWDLYDRWDAAHPDRDRLLDAFSGYWYDYEAREGSYRLWSAGPDQDGETADDIVLDSSSGATPRRRYTRRRDESGAQTKQALTDGWK